MKLPEKITAEDVTVCGRLDWDGKAEMVAEIVRRYNHFTEPKVVEGLLGACGSAVSFLELRQFDGFPTHNKLKAAINAAGAGK